MTVPIVPGPWSFLGEAGKGAKNISDAIIAKRQHDEEEAQRGIAFMMEQIAAGRRDVTELNTPEMQQQFRRARLPYPGPHTIQAPVTGVPGATGTIPLRVPGGFEPGPEDIIRSARARALGSAGPATMRAITQVPSEPVAAAGEAKAVAEGREATEHADAAHDIFGGQAAQGRIISATARSQIDAQIAQNDVTRRVFEGAQRLIGNKTLRIPGFPDETTEDLAGMAATGILPLLTHQLDMNRQYLSLDRQMMSDNLRLLMGVMGEISSKYQNEDAKWRANLSTYMQQAATRAQQQAILRDEKFDPEDAAWQSAVRQEYEKQFGPEPTYDATRDEYLQGMGISLDQFQTSFHRVATSLFGGSGDRQPQPRPDASRPEPPAAVARIAAAAKELRELPKDQQEHAIDVLFGKVTAGILTTVELQGIVSRAALDDEKRAYFDRKLREFSAPTSSQPKQSSQRGR